HHVSRFRADAGEDAVYRRLHFDDGLVGFDLEQHLALADRLAFLFQPRDELPAVLRHLERRHQHADRHPLPAPTLSGVASAWVAAAIISTTCGFGGASV